MVLHPREWAGLYDSVEVRHVSIGGDTPKRLNGTPTFDGIGDVVTDHGLTALRETAKEFKPHAFLFGIHFGLKRKHLEMVKELAPGVVTYMHYTDQRRGVPDEVGRYAGALDVLLLNNQDRADHSKYMKAGTVPEVRTFYDGADMHGYWSRPFHAEHDVFFGGNDHYGLFQGLKAKGRKPPAVLDFPGGEFRSRLMKAVHREFNLLVRGRLGWDGSGLNVRRMRFHPHYHEAMLAGKVVLATVVAPRFRLYMRRLFRTMASGRILVTEYIPGMEADFENHKHLVWFTELDEALDLVRYYLDHEEAREGIVRNGRKTLLRRHTVGHRLGEFITMSVADRE
jgi:hypothetical protein